HYFFKNVDGLWACIDRNCSAVDEAVSFSNRTSGKLYKRPISHCECGGPVVKVWTCRQCGELYFNGFKKNNSTEDRLYIEKGFDGGDYTNVVFNNLNESEINDIREELDLKEEKNSKWKSYQLGEKLNYIGRHRGDF